MDLLQHLRTQLRIDTPLPGTTVEWQGALWCVRSLGFPEFVAIQNRCKQALAGYAQPADDQAAIEQAEVAAALAEARGVVEPAAESDEEVPFEVRQMELLLEEPVAFAVVGVAALPADGQEPEFQSIGSLFKIDGFEETLRPTPQQVLLYHEQLLELLRHEDGVFRMSNVLLEQQPNITAYLLPSLGISLIPPAGSTDPTGAEDWLEESDGPFEQPS